MADPRNAASSARLLVSVAALAMTLGGSLALAICAPQPAEALGVDTPRPGSASAFALHEQTSLLGLAFGLFHSLVLLGDRHTPFTIAQILLPFGAVYRPFAVGLGQLAVYGMTLVAGTFYMRRHIGRRAWRLIHFGSFAVFALALLHGLGASSDRTVMVAGVVPALLILFFGIYRTLAHLARGATPESAGMVRLSPTHSLRECAQILRANDFFRRNEPEATPLASHDDWRQSKT